MRTKLDEIVESVIKDWERSGGCDTELFKQVAERAFRHGVEQTSAMIFRPDYLDGYVQPAPAEEKHFCCTIIGEKPCFCRCHLLAPDRRKGQRRKDERGQLRSFVWQRPEDTHSFGSIFKDDEAECWKLDRRRIKDRRKA